MKAGKMILGILSGAAAGAAVGMLFAPKKGADTRKRIADRSNEYMYETKSKFNDLADNLSHRYDSVKSKMRNKSKKMEASLDGDDKIIY
ncbi:YtxH domain-containing protein [Salinimicrobium gaetbulicola]|uniref:YtxH domain-containing protein n=1 Tax=Salinimicrobium gaetbulicola TaxID=999702 RepID=A0ABW3IAP9_9FLAO